jgi:hypothetical protein
MKDKAALQDKIGRNIVILQWTPLNGITLGQTLNDLINEIITITEYISDIKHAIEGHLALVQCG